MLRSPRGRKRVLVTTEKEKPVNRRRHSARLLASLAAFTLVAASCGSDSDSTSDATTPPTASAEPADTAPSDTEPADTEPADTEPADTEPESTGDQSFTDLEPPTGEPLVLGLINTEGVPGLDYPEIRTDAELAIAFLNEHGGIGGRPIEVETCIASASPETSQACAQELVGKGVEMVMLGLDVFPGYDTFTAAQIPVIGTLPVLPGDYTANALFITGGNATATAGIVAVAVEHFDAKTVGIISADNPGANGSEASLKAALDKAGIPYVSVKGGDNETDAGYQGLIRQATADNPDVLISLYSDAGCIGTMRGRAALGIDTPVLTTNVCAGSEVLDVVGDDAIGWNFIAIGSPPEGVVDDFQAIVEDVHGPNAWGNLGLGQLGISTVMTVARVANGIADAGGEVTGASIYETLATARDLRTFNDNLLGCGTAPSYPSICSLEFPVGEYVPGGGVRTIPGFEALNVADYMP